MKNYRMFVKEMHKVLDKIDTKKLHVSPEKFFDKTEIQHLKMEPEEDKVIFGEADYAKSID